MPIRTGVTGFAVGVPRMVKVNIGPTGGDVALVTFTRPMWTQTMTGGTQAERWMDVNDLCPAGGGMAVGAVTGVMAVNDKVTAAAVRVSRVVKAFHIPIIDIMAIGTQPRVMRIRCGVALRTLRQAGMTEGHVQPGDTGMAVGTFTLIVSHLHIQVMAGAAVGKGTVINRVNSPGTGIVAALAVRRVVRLRTFMAVTAAAQCMYKNVGFEGFSIMAGTALPAEMPAWRFMTAQAVTAAFVVEEGW